MVVLGGSGRVGHRLLETLVARGYAVANADRTVPADDLGVPFNQVDITDGVALTAVLRKFDVVLNAVGPFDRWGGIVVDAAIEAGTDYADICDDPRATLELLERNDRARDAGVRAVVGLGASPGLANMLAVVAVRGLDRTETLVSYWGDSREGMSREEAAELAERVSATFRAGRAAWEHLVVQTTGTVPVWRDGKIAEETPWRDAYRLTLSGGQTGLFRLIGHPEPITLPRRIPTQNCICIGSVGAGVDQLVADAGRAVENGVSIPDALVDAADRVVADPSLLIVPPGGEPLPGLIGAVAMGEKDGARCSVTAMPGGETAGSMSFETARVAVLGAELIEHAPPGVHAPESAFDADAFLSEFAAREWAGAPPCLVDQREGEAVVRVGASA
jgi:hypothetical protein